MTDHDPLTCPSCYSGILAHPDAGKECCGVGSHTVEQHYDASRPTDQPSTAAGRSFWEPNGPDYMTYSKGARLETALAIEAEAIRDYLASEDAEKALAEAMQFRHTMEGTAFVPTTDALRAEARSLLAIVRNEAEGL